MILKSEIEKHNGLLACHDFEAATNAINFDAMQGEMAVNEYGLDSYSAPAMTIVNGNATIKIRGLLVDETGADLVGWGVTGYDVIEHYLTYANDSKNVHSITLDINSGGGYVSGLSHCAKAISNSKKAVHTIVSGDMYSAAYWLGSAAKGIVAGEDSGVGSIGVYLKHYEESKWLEKAGIAVSLFRSGEFKGAFGREKPLSNKEKKRLQADVDASADKFFAHVADNRDISKEAVAALEGDTFTADKALEIGLIDGITTGEKAMTTETKAEQTTNTASAKTEAEIYAQAEANIYAKIEAKKTAKANRAAEINALDGDSTLKQFLASDDYSSLSVDAIKGLLGAVEKLPKSFSAAMDSDGGAGVGADPTNFAEKSNVEKEMAEKEKAAERLKTMNARAF